MKNKLLLIILLHIGTVTSVALNKGGHVSGIYRYYMGIKDGYELWVVDGAKIRETIYPEFLYGGNGQRYRFEPEKEIWIDNTISAEEYRYTLAHELNEHKLMQQFGYTYYAAHDSSLRIERLMRLADEKESSEFEKSLGKVAVLDCDSLKEIAELPDSVYLKNVFRQHLDDRDGVAIWIVDGAVIRKELYPDFGLSGNDLAYYFIPRNEIWIDEQTSCQEIEISIVSELTERKFLAEGRGYDYAYDQSVKQAALLRKKQDIMIKKKAAVQIPAVLDRDKGTGSGKK